MALAAATPAARAAPSAAPNGGGAMLSNGSDRAMLNAGAAQGMGLDAYRSRPVPMAGGVLPGRLAGLLRR
ncbi:hypothetical protein J4558_15175 [Leptolyngbya sp. 15MV]|nr:hypothetical protein J4558_15175 [Leptolyngbya sp. 15MV]